MKQDYWFPGNKFFLLVGHFLDGNFDNHQLTDIPIITAGEVVKTQKSKVIIVMNQYVHLREGYTINSSEQLEAHGIQVDDRAKKHSGLQTGIHPIRYIVPLHVYSGLFYMDIHP